jgi:hypothetical protein
MPNEATKTEIGTAVSGRVDPIVMRFAACKYLDFTDNYTAKKQVLGGGKVFWLRDVSYDPTLPAMVQFCSKRGRLNHPEACLCDRDKRCSDYVDFDHVVNVPDA